VSNKKVEHSDLIGDPYKPKHRNFDPDVEISFEEKFKNRIN